MDSVSTDAQSITSEHSVASSSSTALHGAALVTVKRERSPTPVSNAKAMNTISVATNLTNNNHNNNNSLINNNNNNSPRHKLSPSYHHNNNNNNSILLAHSMNPTALLMHHQQQQHQQHQQQQQQQHQQQNGSRDGNSSRGGSGPGGSGAGSLSGSIGDDRPSNGGRMSHTGRGSSCSPASSPTRHPNAVSPVTSLNHTMMQQMQQQHHQLSPPPHVTGVPTPNGLPAGLPPRMPHGLPPHSLGLLNSLQMMHHASPLELMAAAHHHVPPRSYNSPPPISTSDPSANECKLVEYRGQKVAAFIISGETMLCLPQAFELFLKHLVGGLHTVYTKLKRLDIVPLVCNVEQVRILRGLGAIQPGVNRCKLLCCKDFDVLYRDCTTARCLSIKPPESSRPGRPPKRGPVGLSLPPSHLSQHPQLKKHRLDNGDYAYENGHIGDLNRLDKSPLLANGYNPPPINHMAFMQMNHHPGSALMSPGMPPHGLHARPDSQMLKAAAQGSMSAANMDALARSGIWENCRAAYEDIVKHLERLREERTDERQQMNSSGGQEQKIRDLSSRNSGSPGRQSPVLNLSKSGGNTDQGSNCDDRSEHSEMHSPAHSVREGSDGGGSQGVIGVEDDDDENLSDDNASEVDERCAKDDEDLSDMERDNMSSTAAATSQRHPLHHHHPHHQHHHQLHHGANNAVGVGERVGITGGPGGGVGVGSLGVAGAGLNERDVVNSHAAALQQSPVSQHNAAAVAALQHHHQRALNYSQLAAAAAVAGGAAGGPGGSAALTNGPGSGGALAGTEALLAANDATTAAALAGGLALGPLAMDPHGAPSSTETLLRNIQSLLKVAADNARQQERQISYEKAELKMDVLREREVKDSLDRQLADERKLRVLYQKRYRRERKMRIRYQQQLDGGKRKSTSHSTNMGANSGSGNASNGGNGNCGTNGPNINEEGRNSVGGESKNNNGEVVTRKTEADTDCKSSEKSEKSLNSSDGGVLIQQSQNTQQHQQQQSHQSLSHSHQQQQSQHEQHHHNLRQRSESPTFKREPQSDHDSPVGRRSADRLEHCERDNLERAESRDHGERSERTSIERPLSLPPTSQADSNSLAAAAAVAAAAANGGKAPWNYPGIDLMATGAFWQNYSESLAQEIELERKTRAANTERDVKSPLTERPPAYYKNSMLFGSAN